MIVPPNTSVVVVDGSRVRLFHARAAPGHFDLVELAAPSLGSHQAGSGARHHSSSANPDKSRIGEDDHASAVAAYINQSLLDGALDSLIVVADPRTLGEMRRHYHQVVGKHLLAELDKDMVDQPVGHIREALLKI